MKIRVVRDGDLRAVARLARSSGTFSEEEARAIIDNAHAATEDPRFMRVLCAEDAARVVGVIQYSPNETNRHSVELHWLCVASEARGLGIGTSLLCHMEFDVLRKGYGLILLDTHSSAPFKAARAFYERHGYRRVATIPGYFAKKDDKVIYLKRLRRSVNRFVAAQRGRFAVAAK